MNSHQTNGRNREAAMKLITAARKTDDNEERARLMRLAVGNYADVLGGRVKTRKDWLQGSTERKTRS